MTDLEAHVNREGRDELVRQVRAKIDELGVTYIYYQFISVTGRIVGKGIPADHWEQIAERGFQLVYGSTANLFTDRHSNYIGYGPEASELVGIPDPETFVQLPWDKRVARVFCTCFRNREERENPGGHLTSDCRGNLRIIHDEFQAKHGCRCATAPSRDDVAQARRGRRGRRRRDQAQLLPHRPVRELRPIFMQAIEYGQAMGLDMIQGDHEDAPGQLELNFTYDDALRTADRLTTYRQICARSRASTASSPASCRSPSWGSRRAAATTMSRSGPADPSKSTRCIRTRCPAWRTPSATGRAARTCSCPIRRSIRTNPARSASSASGA